MNPNVVSRHLAPATLLLATLAASVLLLIDEPAPCAPPSLAIHAADAPLAQRLAAAAGGASCATYR